MPLAPRFPITRSPTRGAIARSRSRIGVEFPTKSVPPSGIQAATSRAIRGSNGSLDPVEEGIQRRARRRVGRPPPLAPFGRRREEPALPELALGDLGVLTHQRHPAGLVDRTGAQRVPEGVGVDGEPPRRVPLRVGVQVPPVRDDHPFRRRDECLGRARRRRGTDLDHELRSVRRGPARIPEERLRGGERVTRSKARGRGFRHDRPPERASPELGLARQVARPRAHHDGAPCARDLGSEPVAFLGGELGIGTARQLGALVGRCRQLDVGRRRERFLERAVDVHRPGRVAEQRIEGLPRGLPPPRVLTLGLGQRHLERAAHVRPVQAGLVDRLVGPGAAQARGTVGGEHSERDARLRRLDHGGQELRRGGAARAGDRDRATRRLARARPRRTRSSARRGARGPRRRDAAASASASGVEREPGDRQACATPPATNSSTRRPGAREVEIGLFHRHSAYARSTSARARTAARAPRASPPCRSAQGSGRGRSRYRPTSIGRIASDPRGEARTGPTA